MRCFSHPVLYLVTHRRNMDVELFLSTIFQAVLGGVGVVQLREKEASFHEFCNVAEKLLEFLRPRGVPLIINDRVDVAHAVSADGVHVGQSDIAASEARAVLGSRAIIGLTINTVEQVGAIRGLDIDYVAVSPVFATQTKTDCGPPFGIQPLKELCRLSAHPVVAIGGINRENITQIVRCGVQGVAVASAVFDAPCPQSAAQELVRKLERG